MNDACLLSVLIISRPAIYYLAKELEQILKNIITMLSKKYTFLYLQSFLLLNFSILFLPLVTAQRYPFNLSEASRSLPHIDGKSSNAEYLYTTAGNRLYCIGNQGGAFPPVGFHVPGEMGGIWQQPIKLMDGFGFAVKTMPGGKSYTPACDGFTGYSFATKFHYSIAGENIAVTQTQFVPDDLPVLVVEYKIQNTSNQRKQIEFDLHADINLLPVWLAEKINLKDGEDTLASYNKNSHVLIFKDGLNKWYTGLGFENSHARFKEIKKTPYKGKGLTAIVTLQYNLAAGSAEYFRFYISGSTANSNGIVKNISRVKNQLPFLFEQKKKRYRTIEQTATIKVPDSLLQTAYNWGKYITDWLQRDVPRLGEGLSAGLPDYPWFFSNDQASTFMALTGTMPPRLFYNSFRFLKDISDKTNDTSGQIIHEVSDNGVVYNKGNMQESQLHIIAAWQIFKWTGNRKFLKENYAFAKRTWTWLQQYDTNHNGYIEGYGGVEIEGLDDEMLDVQVNTYRFLDVLGQMAIIFKEDELAKEYAAKATQLKNNINKDWWIESEHCYADFRTTKVKALRIIDDALAKRVNPERNKWAQVKLNKLKTSILNNTYASNGYLVYYNASILDPVTEGMTDTVRALQMIQQASFFTNKFGTYIAGIERPDDVTIDERAFQKDSTFTYNRAVMPAASSGLIQAAALYGMPDTALKYMHQTLNTFSYATPGTMYEVSPDYGMFVQAWNISCLNIPLIQYFFGVNPDAYNKEITIHLQMPVQWKEASLKNLLVGSTKLSVDYKKQNNQITCNIQSSEPGWKIHFVTSTKPVKMIVNKKNIFPQKLVVELTGTSNTVVYTTDNK